MRNRLGALLVTLLLAPAGCGGGGGPSGPGGNGMIAGGGKLTWLDDGARHAATFAAAALARSAMMDYLQISGGEPSGVGISFGIATNPPIGMGQVDCGAAARPFASFSYSNGVEPVYTSCSVTVSGIVLDGITRVVGTFEAVYPKTGGGTKTLSEGTFDLPMTVSTL